MQKEIHLKLTRVARSKGGDRYEAEIEGEEKPLVIYLSQSISRKGNIVLPGFRMSLEPMIE